MQGGRLARNQYIGVNESDSQFFEDPYLRYTLPVVPSTTYRLRLGFPTHLCRIQGFCQLNIYVDGETIAENVDLYVINPKATAPYILDLPGKSTAPYILHLPGKRSGHPTPRSRKAPALWPLLRPVLGL